MLTFNDTQQALVGRHGIAQGSAQKLVQCTKIFGEALLFWRFGRRCVY